jgi:hypothetical protein
VRQRTQRTWRPSVPITVALTWYVAAQFGQAICIGESSGKVWRLAATVTAVR